MYLNLSCFAWILSCLVASVEACVHIVPWWLCHLGYATDCKPKLMFMESNRRESKMISCIYALPCTCTSDSTTFSFFCPFPLYETSEGPSSQMRVLTTCWLKLTKHAHDLCPLRLQGRTTESKPEMVMNKLCQWVSSSLYATSELAIINVTWLCFSHCNSLSKCCFEERA